MGLSRLTEYHRIYCTALPPSLCSPRPRLTSLLSLIPTPVLSPSLILPSHTPPSLSLSRPFPLSSSHRPLIPPLIHPSLILLPSIYILAVPYARWCDLEYTYRVSKHHCNHSRTTRGHRFSGESWVPPITTGGPLCLCTSSVWNSTKTT